ncbi:BREX-1 system adenine-specific DNA-methyltransferase PglX [Nostoc sp. XA010]|uniref:BREX-1 system adenine-specific DNA-methyltransferase PglX n=1 Tax=Nostoc sp. XA010 TaxID=2780407 RepID=UPI001E2F5F4D|nr:BREX-1 system adenine-specific DNA-methyltransferase PglX [Nostoc sp. XA010]
MRTVSLEYYGIAGGTYTERTTSNLSVRVLPSGCIINFAGPGIYQSFSFPAYGLVGLLNSTPYQFMIELIVGGGDTSQAGTAARHFLPSLIEALPAPNEPKELLLSISNHCRELYEIARIDRDDETREFFYQPIYNFQGLILSEVIDNEFNKHEDRLIKAIKLAEKIDLKVADNLALSLEEREELRNQLGRPFPVKCLNIENTKKIDEIKQILEIGRINNSETENESTSRAIIKRCFVLDNLLESICHLEDISIESLVEIRRKAIPTPQWYRIEITQAVISYVLGCILGRWDIRFATSEKQPSELPDPFAPLPVCSPGMLIGEDGLPLHETPFNYPIQIRWDGILRTLAKVFCDMIRNLLSL